MDFTPFFFFQSLLAPASMRRRERTKTNGTEQVPDRPPASASFPDPQQTSGVGGPPYPVFLHSRSSVLSLLPLPRPMLHSRGEPLACLPGPWATHPIAEPQPPRPVSLHFRPTLAPWREREERGVVDSSSCARRSGYWLEGSRWIWSPGWTGC